MDDDTIYRQTAIDAMKELCENYTRTTSTKHPHIDFIIEELEALPSAQRIGRWIVDKDSTGCMYGKCTSCGMKQYAGRTKFCPNCGAKMEVEK